MNLLTLEEYKAFKGISGFTEDNKITPLITAVSQFIKTYCGRTFVDYYATNLVETFNISWDTSFVTLRETPVVELVSVEERESLADAYVALTSAEFYLDPYLDVVYRVNTNGNGYTKYKQGPGAVRITYKAGYASCPEDLKLAATDLINYHLKEDFKSSRSIGTTSMQGPTSKGIIGGAALPDHIKRVLDLYR